MASGHVKQEHYDQIRKELYQDEMIPSIGNKRAFRDHMAGAGGQGGVHVMLDMNGLKSMNDTLGHASGDAAITAAGNALRSAADKTIGADAHVHRFGGDELHLHVPTHEHAAQVLRAYRSELEAVPSIAGTHKVSMSAGIGADPRQADAALYHAKAQGKAAISAAGGDPTSRTALPVHHLYAHSLTPGYEGPVPTSQEQLMIHQPGEQKLMQPTHLPPVAPAGTSAPSPAQAGHP